MSIGMYIDCNHCSDVLTSRPTAWQCRELAKGLGWHVSLPGGRDVCDNCWKKGLR